jgi:hypothetical protein
MAGRVGGGVLLLTQHQRRQSEGNHLCRNDGKDDPQDVPMRSAICRRVELGDRPREIGHLGARGEPRRIQRGLDRLFERLARRAVSNVSSNESLVDVCRLAIGHR